MILKFLVLFPIILGNLCIVFLEDIFLQLRHVGESRTAGL